MSSRREIAEEILGAPLVDGQYAVCPGRAFHSKGNGKRDFRVVLDGAPTGYCFHGSCSGEVEAFNKRLRTAIWLAERGDVPAPRGHWGQVAQEPKAEVKARPELNREKVEEFVRGVPVVDEEWLRRRSPVDTGKRIPDTGEQGTAALFLDALYEQGERVLVFIDHRSQGDFLFEKGRGSFRLSQERGVKGVRSVLPEGGKEGVWFLVQPVTGLWAINAKVGAIEGAPARYSRRSEGNVTAWRFFVLESDVLEPELWLRVLAALPLPIAAIYTSGGRSIHALVRFPVDSKSTWDQVRNTLRQIVCPLGADPAALTAVRLSRLPGCKRGGRMQELLYLDPGAEGEALQLKREVRA